MAISSSIFLAAVAESGSLDGAYLEEEPRRRFTTSGESLVVHILGDDEQRTATLGTDSKHGKKVL